MADRDVIEGLIATYRELNQRFRPILAAMNAEAGSIDDPASPLGILYRLRNRELNASQAIKEMLRGGERTIVDDEGEALVTVQQTALGLIPTVLLSQFGTAREATLAMVRDLPDSVWQQEFETPRGRMTLRAYLETLIQRDREAIRALEERLGQIAPQR